MRQPEKKKGQDHPLICQITNYASVQPFMGVSVSIINALFLLFSDKLWSWKMACYECIPLFGFTAIYAFFAITMKIKYSITVPFFYRKIKRTTIFLYLVFIALTLMLKRRT
ncbi:MAG: hypothetical protein LKJ17_08170 [Oscillospiraceae bacterium]|nr:hypothetical protein [Oscillospiraceae bacterium]